MKKNLGMKRLLFPKMQSVMERALLAAIVCLVFTTPSYAGQGLKTINNPGGGMIVYGPVGGQKTEAGAMGAVLRSLASQYGNRPEVGRVFRVRDTNSYAVFFTLVKRNQGNVKVAGMLIASRFAPNHIEAALVTDDAARFGSTVNPMLGKLFSVWHPGAEASSSGPASGTRSAPAAALRPYTLPDRSASVGVPDGWQVDRNSAGGTMIIRGPHGELAGLGLTRMGVDPTNANRRQLQRGGAGNYDAGKIIYPYNVNLAKAFPDILQQFRRVNGLSPAGLEIAHAEQISGLRGQHCAHVTGLMNPDGKGMQEMNSLLCTTSPSRFGDYLVIFYHTLLPKAVADKERATMGAVLASFRENMAVINGQADALAAPRIAAINAIGDAARKRGAETSALYDRQNRAWEKGQDSQARHNKAFSNYLLDQSVVRDNQQNAHGTAWNQTADALVRHNPQRYEYVNTGDFRKGIDY